MKRIVLFFICIFILSACNSGTEDSDQNQADSADTEEKTEEQQQTNDEKEAEEVAKEKEETEDTIKPQYEVAEDWSLTPIEEGINEKVVLLTIDDAPDQNAMDMARTLKDLNAKAIFFVNGHFLETPEQEEMLKEIHEMGFPIGNHTYNHATLTDVSEEEQREEIISLNDRIEEIIGERPAFFRAPHGANTDYSIQVAEEEGMTVMNWTYGYDYFEPYTNAEKLTKAMITGEGPEAGVPHSLLKPGATLLMHDREWTAEALPNIVKGLREKGYEMLDPALIKTNKR